jgi:hypothetical protein
MGCFCLLSYQRTNMAIIVVFRLLFFNLVLDIHSKIAYSV